MMENLANFESEILLFVQEFFRNDILNPIFVFITKLGDHGLIWIIVALVLIVHKQTRWGGFAVLFCLALSFIANDLIIKNIVQRTRPYEVIEGLKTLVPAESSFSFPSGHTNASFAAAMGLTLAFGKKGAWSFILAALIAFSRVFVGVHYPTDIIFGIIVGSSSAYLGFKIFNRFFNKKTT